MGATTCHRVSARGHPGPTVSGALVVGTREGRARFVVVPLDEGDAEVLAIQKNARLMAYLAECVERARTGPTKSLAQLKAELGLDHDADANSPGSPGADAPRREES